MGGRWIKAGEHAPKNVAWKMPWSTRPGACDWALNFGLTWARSKFQPIRVNVEKWWMLAQVVVVDNDEILLFVIYLPCIYNSERITCKSHD